MLIGIFYSQIVESSSLVSVFFRAIIHPYVSFSFYLLVNGFSVTSFQDPLPLLYWWAVLVGGEELKWHQLKTAHKDLILVYAVQLKPEIKVQISGRMASIGMSDVVTASVYSEKTRMKKLMMMKMIIIIIIITRADRHT